MAVSSAIKEMIERSSWIRRMFEKGTLLKKEYGAENVYDFSLGNPNLDPPKQFSRILKKILDEDIPAKHSYMPNAGYPEVREKIARYIQEEYNIEITKEYVIMTCGAGGALNAALKTILNPSDIVLTSVPGFMEYHFYVDNHRGILDFILSKDDFDLDVEKMASRITKETAAVIINSPNNPTGRVYPAATLEKLGLMLEEESRRIGRTIYLISDEPYRKIIYDDIEVPSVFSYYPHSIVVTSFSKDLSIPGERIGWLAVNPRAEAADEFMNGAILCNRILGYVNAPALMQRTVAELLYESVDIEGYKRKRDLLCSRLEEIGYRFTRPEGTFYLFPEAPGGDDSKAVDALQEERVLAVPGRGFGRKGYFRIAFCVDDKVIEGSFQGFEKAFRKLTRN